ncbi:MAG: tetratricopeptide repeat protein [Bacteroidota bacterium]
MRFFVLFIFIFSIFTASAQRKTRQKEIIFPQTQADSLKLEGVLIDAEKQLMLENFSKALEGFTVALGMNSQSAAIQFKIAEVLAKSGEGQKALPYGLKAIELDPENKYYRLSLARIYRSVGFYIESAKIYEGMLEEFPSEESALYELAELYQLTGRIEEMFATFDRIELQLGVKEEIVREKQRIYMKQGKIEDVIREYQKLSDAYPNESAYRIELINFLIQNSKLEEASQQIAIYELSEPASARIKLLKSEVFWKMENYTQSLQLLSEAFDSPVIDFESKFQIVSNYLLADVNAQNSGEITNLVKKLAAQYPDEFRAQAFLGDLLYQSEQLDEALLYYLKAVRINPANYKTWQNILNVEAELNQYDSLVVHSEEALTYFPNQALLYYFSGTGHLIKNNYQKAVNALETGKKYSTDPNLLTIFFGQLGDAYNGLKMDAKSYKAYDKALEYQAENDHVLNNYSYFLSLAKSDLDKALEMSTRLVKSHPYK